MRELKSQELKRYCYDDELKIDSVEQIEPISRIIGQERAAEALNFGLNIKTKGYNIYVSGMRGTGKTTFAEKFARQTAQNEPVPDDLCYVYNFDNPQTPVLLKLSAGRGKEFKDDIDELVHFLSVEIPKAYNAQDYEDEKDKIVKEYQDKRDGVIKNMTNEAKEHGFGVKMTNSGMYFMPIIDGVTISEDEFDELNDEQKDKISEKSDIIQEKAAEVMDRIKDFETDTKKEIDDIEYNIALFTVGHYFQPVQEKYSDNERVSEYLLKLKEYILANIDDFIEEDCEDDEALSMLPLINRKNGEDNISKYCVNLIVDNSKLTGAPVIVDYNPTYANLTGEVEYDNEYGNFTTDYMKIKAGLLHKANGGYLILQIEDVLSNAYAWEAIKRTIRTNELKIEPLKEYQISGISISSIKPEKADINVKLLLIGSEYYYNMLSEYDDEFLKFFKICSSFDYEMDNTAENIRSVARFVKNFTIKEKSLDFDMSAIKAVIEHSYRIAERQDKLTTRFNKLNEILAEASAWAVMDGEKTVTDKYIVKAVEKKNYFNGLYEEKLTDMIMSNDIMIETDGKAVGQINGLAVIDTGDSTFGKPTRITASTYLGKCGIVNIEKEAELSGCIHDKGIQIIAGYLGESYAQSFPLTLSCRICFEQNYSGVDGDSASSTELYAILSSLSGLPLRQDIAVTGSVNQKGMIQPIGGVIHKIEGFYDICKRRGLTGNQGVMIPIQNESDLVLSHEVISAVESGKFHIYSISTIDEGIEFLTGVKAGKRSGLDRFEPNTVNGLVYEKLKAYYYKSVSAEY